MADDIKTVTYKMVVDAMNAIENLSKLIAKQKEEAAAAKLTSAAIKEQKRELDLATAQVKATEAALRTAAQANKALATSSKETSSAVSGMGNALKQVAGAIAGMFAIQNIINFAREAAMAYEEFSQTLFKFEVSVRALQRSGMDTTMAEWKAEVDRINSSMKIFTDESIMNALSRTSLMTREFGLSKDQMVALTETALKMSMVTGQDLETSITSVTKAIASGYTKGLQAANIGVSRATLNQRALAMGYKDTYDNLTPAIRAQIMYLEILDKSGKVTEDYLEFLIM